MGTEVDEEQAAVARGVADVARALSPAAFGEAMADELIAAIPEFTRTAGDEFRVGLVASCRANLEEIQRQLLSGRPSYEIVAPEGAIAWGRELVHRGLPLASLLRAYRLGHGLFERSFEQLAAEQDFESEIRWRMLVSASRYVFVYIDTVCTQLTQDFEAEREQWVRGADAARLATARAIADGRAVDPEEATSALRYDVTRSHLAIIVWSDPSAGGRAAALAAAAHALASEVGGGPTTTVPIGEHCVWAWTGADAVVAQLPARSSTMPDGIAAALGTVQSGVEGMARSHHEARAARRVGEVFGRRPGALMRYQSVALASLLSADPAHAVRFAQDELGVLGAPSDLMARLRATLRVYLEERLSPSRTSRRLGIHQNTVVYRVRQAEELLGRPIDERRLELEVALRLCDALDGLALAATMSQRD